MNDQISADLQRLIGRVWMAAYEAGKREALEPKDPDTMRREALAAALAQDGADERVRADWAVEGPVMVSVPVGTSVNYENGTMKVEPPADLSPINRADVRLKEGDVVADEAGNKVTVVRDDNGGIYPIVTSDGYTYTSRGFQVKGSRSGVNIVSVNGRPIIDSEEA